MESKHRLVNGVLFLDNAALQCPFRAPVSYIQGPALVGKPPEVVVRPHYCGAVCPLFRREETTVTLHCAPTPLSYHVEVVESKKVRIGNA